MIENSKKQEWSRSTEADGMAKRINVRETDNNKFTVLMVIRLVRKVKRTGLIKKKSML
jgi:hypothetical protein